jgi:hypothetical protein
MSGGGGSRAAPPAGDACYSLDIEGRAVPLRVRRNARARRLVLRIDAAADGAVVTLPPGVPVEDGLDMARQRAAWIAGRLAALPARMPLADGARVPFLGVEHPVRHRPGCRGTAWLEDGEIHVAGGTGHLARRLTDWLKGEARRRIAPLVADKAARLGQTAGRITLRDTRSRWGSCSANGNLSFCWRLVMAPETVLDYVVAHEVAHLAERGHGPRFWSAVDELTSDSEGARAWLRDNGDRLHRYG